MDDPLRVLQTAGSWLTILTAFILLRTLILNANTASANIAESCAKRFYDIVELKLSVHNGTYPETQYFYHFWSLQFEQFHYFHQGLLDIDLYKYFLRRRNEEWRMDETIKTLTYHQG